jgi:hypothetical protein
MLCGSWGAAQVAESHSSSSSDSSSSSTQACGTVVEVVVVVVSQGTFIWASLCGCTEHCHGD